MEELKRSLRILLTEMCCKCTSETAVSVQDTALEMNVFYGSLCQMVIEYAHAKEFLDMGRKKDIIETQEEYDRTIQKMIEQIKKCSAALHECPEEDHKLIHAVSEYLSVFGRELKVLQILGKKEPDTWNCQAYQKQLERLCRQSEQSGKLLVLSHNMEQLVLLPYERYSEQTGLAIGALGMTMQLLYRRLRQMQDVFADNAHRDEDGLWLMKKNLQHCLDTLERCSQDEAAVIVLCEWTGALIWRIGVFIHECQSLSEADYKKNLDFLYQICEDYIRLRIGDQSYLD